MKPPLTFSLQQDLMALKWLAKAVVVFVILYHWIYNWEWVKWEILEPYTRVLAWELEHTLRLLGYDVVRNQNILTVIGLPYKIRIVPRCLGFIGGGFFVFVATVLTLPSSTLRARVFWLITGSLVLAATNLLRITVVILLCTEEPSSFDPIHKLSMDANTLVGGILALLAVRSLTLNPMGIKVFRRSPPQGVPEPGGVGEGK